MQTLSTSDIHDNPWARQAQLARRAMGIGAGIGLALTVLAVAIPLLAQAAVVSGSLASTGWLGVGVALFASNSPVVLGVIVGVGLPLTVVIALITGLAWEYAQRAEWRAASEAFDFMVNSLSGYVKASDQQLSFTEVFSFSTTRGVSCCVCKMNYRPSEGKDLLSIRFTCSRNRSQKTIDVVLTCDSLSKKVVCVLQSVAPGQAAVSDEWDILKQQLDILSAKTEVS